MQFFLLDSTWAWPIIFALLNEVAKISIETGFIGPSKIHKDNQQQSTYRQHFVLQIGREGVKCELTQLKIQNKTLFCPRVSVIWNVLDVNC